VHLRALLVGAIVDAGGNIERRTSTQQLKFTS
jgi:hypothetical protein